MQIYGGIAARVQSVKCPGLDMWISTHPYHGEATGGDLHFVSLCGGGMTTRILLADVSGHGDHVLDYSLKLQKLVKRYINSKTQAGFMSDLNKSFAEYAQLSRFATAVFCTYLANKNSLELCIAGHPRPLWYQKSRNQWSYLGESAKPFAQDIGVSNLPLGIDEEARFETFQFEFSIGDFLIFYTDSFTESKSPSNHMLNEDGLLNIFRKFEPVSMDCLNLGNRGIQLVSEFRNHQPADDDETILVIQQNGTGKRPMGIGDKIDVYAKFFGLRSYGAI